MEECGLLLLQLSLLLLELLLLEILDLGVDVGNGLAGRCLRHHVRGHGRHGGRVVLKEAVASRNHVGGIRVTHDSIGGLARLGHDGMRAVVLEVLEVKLHAVAHVGHAADVEKLLEVILRRCSHGLVLRVPRCGAHHGDV